MFIEIAEFIINSPPTKENVEFAISYSQEIKVIFDAFSYEEQVQWWLTFQSNAIKELCSVITFV